MAGRFGRAAIGLVAAGLLAACLPVSGGMGPAPAGPNVVTGPEIAVTELDPGPGAKPAPAKAPKTAPKPEAKPAPVAKEPPKDPPAAPAVKPKPRPAEAAAEDAEAAEPAPEAPPAAPAVPQEQKSAAQIACEKKKGVWAAAANGLRACVTYTKDSGKSCRKASDCEGECLARSATCAPFKPLFGCNEVLDDAGRRMTLCLD